MSAVHVQNEIALTLSDFILTPGSHRNGMHEVKCRERERERERERGRKEVRQQSPEISQRKQRTHAIRCTRSDDSDSSGLHEPALPASRSIGDRDRRARARVLPAIRGGEGKGGGGGLGRLGQRQGRWQSIYWVVRIIVSGLIQWII